MRQIYNEGEGTKTNASSETLTRGPSLQDGLVGHWTFDGPDINWTSATAGTAMDRSGQGNDGTLAGMNQRTSPAIGKLGQALSFDGGSDWIDLGEPAALDFKAASSSFYITAWIKPTQTNTRGGIFKRGHPTSNTPGSQYILSTYVSNNRIEFRIGDGTNQQAFLTSQNSITPNKWSFVACGSDGLRLYCYIDGVREFNAPRNINTTGGTDRTMIGATRIDQGRFPGMIDDVRIYNRALTEAEIKQLYFMGR